MRVHDLIYYPETGSPATRAVGVVQQSSPGALLFVAALQNRTTRFDAEGAKPGVRMSNAWFTANTHFAHANIIRHCRRPFADARTMDASLIANWNGVVRPDDEVWHLGDFAFRAAASVSSYLQPLNGRVHLVCGNHDSPATRADPAWASSQAMAEVSVDGQDLVLCHYAMRVWPGSHRGAIHLFGHSHGTLSGDTQSGDVGVDVPAFRYRPVSLVEIRRHLARQPVRTPPDHHGRSGTSWLKLDDSRTWRP